MSEIEDFIADESKALAARRRGSFYSNNHHRLHPAFKKNFKNLPPQVLEDFYFHLLRTMSSWGSVEREQFPILLKAYDRIVQLSKSERLEYPICSFSRFEGLYFFGYDSANPKDSVGARTFDDFTKAHAFSMQVGKYTSLDSLLKKLPKVMPFARDSVLIQIGRETLKMAKFQHGSPIMNKNFKFCGLLVLLLLEGSAESLKTFQEFEQAPLDPAASEERQQVVKLLRQSVLLA